MVKAPAASKLVRRVDAELLAFIETERPMLEPEAHPLLDELEALVLAGGKRLRPRFCYWGYIAGGGKDGDEILRVGASLELLHTFALIHDDVMDRSPLRRNRLTTFRALAELSAGTPHRGDPNRFGTSAAILTGLLGFVLADRLFLMSGFASEIVMRAAERFDRMRTGAIAGQYLDLLAAHRGTADEATARRIGALKSGGYTIADPLAIGALCAPESPTVLGALDEYGRPLGEAFQLRDDVLGAFGDPAETGKDTVGDLREGKQTVMLATARAAADASQLAVLDRLVGNPDLSPSDTETVREILEQTGARRATEDLIEQLTDQARASVDADLFGHDAANALHELADEVTHRRA